MVLKRLFGRKDEEDVDSYVELDIDESPERDSVLIVVEKLESGADVERIKRLIRDNFIVFVSIKAIKERDMSELKRYVSSIKKTCIAVNGDIVGVSDEWLIATPAFASVYREEQPEVEE